MENEYAHMLMNLILVLAFMLVLVFILKKMKFAKQSANQAIKVINMVSIGTKEKIILLDVRDKVLLVGVTPNHIQTLHVFDGLHQNQSKEFSGMMKDLEHAEYPVSGS